jgi:hypothetical protein
VLVGVDHPGQHQAAAGVDLLGAVGDGEADADRGDPAVYREDVVVFQDGVGGIHSPVTSNALEG